MLPSLTTLALVLVQLFLSASAQTWYAGSVMNLATCDGSVSQIFKLTTNTDVYSQIIHVASNLCVEMFVGADTGRLPQLKLAICSTSLQQLWIVNTTADVVRNNNTISGCKGFNVWTSSWVAGNEVGPYDCSNDFVGNNELLHWNVNAPYGSFEAYTSPGVRSTFCMSVSAPVTLITLDNALPNLGPVFDGIGVGASEGSSRLLFDYPIDVRNKILDNMFAPGLGSGIHILKLEIGGDGDGTAGSEPSHKHFPDEIPVSRGTQLWLASEAKKRNPSLLLYACPWSWPGWLRQDPTDTTPFGDSSQAVNYIVSWLLLAKSQYGLTFDYLGVWSDVWDATLSPAYIKRLKPALDLGGFSKIKIVCADIDNWDCATALSQDPVLADAISILGNEGIPSPDVIATASSTGKSLWNSWLHLDDSVANFEAVPRIVDAIQEAFVKGNQTAVIPFAAFSGTYLTIPEWGAGAIRTDNPWGGSFYNGPLWFALAHSAQFASPGYMHLANNTGSGLLANGGSYITRISAATGPNLFWSTVVSKTSQSAKAELIMFTLANDMKASTVYIWQSQFGFSGNNITLFAQTTMDASSGQFSVWFDQGSVTTITNNPSFGNKPANQPDLLPTKFPSFFADDFSAGSVNQPGQFWTDINGAFEIVDDDSAGRGLQQTAQMVPITRRNTDRNPHTVLGDPSWRDIDFLSQVFLSSSTDAAGLCVRCSAFNDTSGTDGSTGIDNMPGEFSCVIFPFFASVIHFLNFYTNPKPFDLLFSLQVPGFSLTLQIGGL
jgi:galactosylceramidase